jgi:hypothetical protein
VPLQRSALDALDQLPPRPTSTSLLFPAPEGSYRDLHNWRPRHWRPAQDAAGITPTRRLYDLRHTFATDALRAGLGTLELSRYMGTSLINIDRTYGHLARDSHHHAIQLLDDYSRPDVTQHTPAVQRTVWHPPLPTGYPAAGAANVGGAASLESYRDPAHPARRSSSSQPPRLPHADATACSLAKRRISSAREWMPSLR